MRVFAAGSSTNLTIEVTWRSGVRSVVRGCLPNHVYEIDEAGAHHGGGVHQADLRAFAEDRLTRGARDGGGIIGRGALDDEADVRAGEGCGSNGAAATDFLLYRGDSEQGIRAHAASADLMERLDDNGDADAVVERLGAEE